MLYEEGIQIGATLLTILLPTVTAIFAFRSAERKIKADRERIPTISYEEPIKRISDAVCDMAKVSQRTADREYEWQQAVLRELRAIAGSLGN